MRPVVKIGLNLFAAFCLAAPFGWFPGDISAQTAQYRFPLWLSDSLGAFMYIDTLWFGLHPQATTCVDDSLGEFFMFTECGNFSQHCAQFVAPFYAPCSDGDFPVTLDLRRSWNTAQVDTYRVIYYGTHPVVLHWPNNLAVYYDSCHLYDAFSFYLGFPRRIDVNMLTLDSATISGIAPYDMWGVIIRTVGPSGTTEVKNQHSGLPVSCEVSNNFPNPFNPQTTFRVGLAHTSYVRIGVFNSLGQRIAQLVNSVLPAGRHEVVWHGTNSDGISVGSGVYFLHVFAEPTDGSPNAQVQRRMILLR